MATWQKIRPNQRSVISAQVANEPDPTDPADGFSLEGVAGFHLVVECDVGHTFIGTAGKFAAFISDPDSAGPAKAEDSLDVAVTPSQVGKRRIVFAGFRANAPRARIAHVAQGVQISGGGLTLRYVATTAAGFRT